MSAQSDIGFHDGSIPVRVTGAIQAEVDGEFSPADFLLWLWEPAGPCGRCLPACAAVGQIVTALETAYIAQPGVVRAETVEFMDALRAAILLTFE
jgi:hypothetical protein